MNVRESPSIALLCLSLSALTVFGCGESVDHDGTAGGASAPDRDGDQAPDDADLGSSGTVYEDASGGAPGSFTLGAGSETTLSWSGTPPRLTLSQGEVPLLFLPLEGFQVGVVPKLDSTLSYDPHFFDADSVLGDLYSPPEGLEWLSPTGVQSVSVGDDGAASVVLVTEDGTTMTFLIKEDARGRFRAHWTADAGDDIAVYFRLRPRVDDEEGFYGMGEVFDHVNHRGMARPMQIMPAQVENGHNEVHVPIPLLVGTTGWGLFVESMHPGSFAVATEADDLVQVTFGLGADHADGLVFHLLGAEHPLDITGLYYDITGRPGPYAPWALGPWIWRDEVAGQALVEADLQTIRDLDLATTGYWIDRPYATDVNSFDFKASDYDDPEAMFALASSLGFAMALWHTPYVDPDGVLSGALYQEADAAGYFAPLGSTGVYKWGPPLDFTNPEAMTWWQSLLEPYRALGVVGYKLDYAEEVVTGVNGLRLPWSFYDGSDELTMHRRYQLLYHQAYAEMLPEEGGFLLCRAGAYGDQAQGVIIWPGDIDARMTKHREPVTEPDGTSYLAIGGLPAAIVAGSSLGVSGFPLFASDTGGYEHSPPTREVFIRWFQHTAFSPAMQVGTSTNDLPWAFGADSVFDEELVALYRDFARLHLRLHPYLWSYVRRLSTDGRPIQRPLGLAHPELGVHPDDVYMLGDHLLVAPVIEEGATSRTITLPTGPWLDWWDGERVIGDGQTLTVSAPLEEIPVFVRAGQPLPMLPADIDTLLPTTDPTVRTTQPEGEPLHVLLTPGPDGLFELYDGTTIRHTATDTAMTIEIVRGAVFNAEVSLEVFGLETSPSNLGALNATWDARRGGTASLVLGPNQSIIELIR